MTATHAAPTPDSTVVVHSTVVHSTAANSTAVSSTADASNSSTRTVRFLAWYRTRPLVGTILMILAGIEMFFSGQLDVGNIHVQIGIEGLQATILPLALVLLGILTMLMPVHRIFYGVIALALSVYSLIGLNLGGFFIGMLLGTVGGVLAVSWSPRVPVPPAVTPETGPPRPPFIRSGARDAAAVTQAAEAAATAHDKGADTGATGAAGAADATGATGATDAKRSRKGLANHVSIILCLALGLGSIAAAPVPTAEHGAVCVPVLGQCNPGSGSGQPSPTSPAVPVPTVPGHLPAPGIPPTGQTTVPGDAAPSGTPTVLSPDPGASTFTQPAAQMGGSAITITGPHKVSLVTVPLADGSTTPALKIEADDIIVKDFILDVMKPGGSILVTTSSQMELRGHVVVYLDSFTGLLGDGSAVTLGMATPPSGDELPPTVFRFTMGFIGLSSDVCSMAASHEKVQLPK